ncbi:MAG: DUF302 domain-containing protein [Deltaproteobacteria bacterium]|nr:DUF302 domain-containing protein [Deltaproteobacteria bacterium]
MTSVGMKKVLELPFDSALDAVTQALGKEGFGVLTDIDVAATLQKKLGVDFRRYRILGACNPALAHRVLSADLNAGVMLPCNVVVYEEAPNRTVVTAVDPLQTMAKELGPEVRSVAEEVRVKLGRILSSL